MAMRQFVVFQANSQAGSAFVAPLQRSLHDIVNDTQKVLKAWGEEWKRQVQRVSPVETGRMRQSWVTIVEKSGYAISVTLANTIKGQNGEDPYPMILEFGTDRIARGRVKRWTRGDPPVMDWPAKNNELPSLLNVRPGARGYESRVDVLSRAFTQGTGEQMPMVRPTGYEIAPKVVEDVQQAIVEGFQAVVGKRRG